MKVKRAPRRGRFLTRSFPAGLILVLALAILSLTSLPRAASARSVKQDPVPQATQAVFTNSAPITWTTGAPNSGSLYPSPIVVSGIVGSIPATPGSVRVTINNFSHSFTSDLGFVLVGPTGAAFLIQDAVGGEEGVTGVTYTLSDAGATVLPEVAWAAGTYKPTTYFLGDSFPAPGPLTAYSNPGPASGGTATFSSVFGGTNPNGTWNLYTRDFVTGDGGSMAGGWSLEIVPGAPANCTTAKRPLDFDGDGKTDFQVMRNTGGGPGGQLTWFTQNVATGAAGTAQPWGLQGDAIVPADYDGDGKADIAVWRTGPPFGAYFFILQSQTNTLRIDQFGQTNDDPSVVGDYDGDGKADPAVYRSGAAVGDHSFWWYRSSLTNVITLGAEFGQTGDFPAPGDYDGDGKYDYGVQRNNGGGQAGFHFRLSGGGTQAFVYGTPTDVILPGLYDSDCKTDIAVVRGSGGLILWNIRNSTDGSTTTAFWGNSATDFTVQGDYDGDGKTDLAVWRPNADPNLNFFHVKRSSDGTLASFEWGQNGDYPTANFNAH